ncbi:MAG: hypothetical protein V3T17_09420 [Pseudomonadales bacterium]
MESKRKRIIYVATTKELLNMSYYRRLWLAARNISIPRRAWLDELANTLRDFNGNVIHRSGIPYDLPLVDEIFGDDYDMRWLGYYLQPDKIGKSPKSISRKLERLRLIVGLALRTAGSKRLSYSLK